jgi:hypothetical protein
MNKLNSNQHPQYKTLNEGLEYKDMVGILKPTMHIDEFSSKMGDDDDVIVVSFFVRNKQAAQDLANWFEKGYDWVLDADISPGEIKPGRFLVYIELRRRSSAGRNLAVAVEDLASLTEYEPSNWVMVYKEKETPFSQEEFDRQVPLSPKQYRKEVDGDLNEMRAAAGIEPKQIYEREQDIQQLQAAAGI